MYELTKAQVKTRLIVSFVLAIIWTVVMTLTGMMEGVNIIAFVLAPIIMTWVMSTITFGPMVYLKNMIPPSFRGAICLISFRFGEAISELRHPWVWYCKALIEVIKLTFWSFTKDDE